MPDNAISIWVTCDQRDDSACLAVQNWVKNNGINERKIIHAIVSVLQYIDMQT